MKQIKAFTILELIIALLLSSIILAISYYTYFLLNNQLVTQQKKNGIINEFQLFENVFQNDFSNAAFIKDTMKTNSLIFFKTDNEFIKYEFNENNIVRSFDSNNDTFRLKGKIDKLYLKDDSLPVINKILFIGLLEKEKITTIFTKYYSASQLMKASSNE